MQNVSSPEGTSQVDKSWKLNARHSGGLQGLTQAEAVERYGESKVTLWRSPESAPGDFCHGKKWGKFMGKMGSKRIMYFAYIYIYVHMYVYVDR